MNDLRPIQQRIKWVLFAAQSFFSASTIAMFTLTPIIVAQLAGTEKAAGIPNTWATIGRALFALPMGYLMDRFGRRIALAGGYGMASIGAAVSVFAVVNQSYWLFLLGAFLVGTARAASEQSRYVAAEVFPLGQRPSVIGIIVFAGTIGSVVGPLLVAPSSRLVERWGWQGESGPFVVAFFSILIAAAIVFGLLFPDPREIGKLVVEKDSADTPTPQTIVARPLTEIFRQPISILAVLSMTISFFVMSFIMVITPLQMNHHNHGTEAISLVMMAHTMGMFGLSWLTGSIIERIGRIQTIIAGALILILACAIAPLSADFFPLATALFLLGLGWNWCYVGGSSLLATTLNAPERARAQGFSEMIIALGQGIASYSAGYAFAVSDYFGMSMIGIALTLLLIVAILVGNRPNSPS